jgi:hypothetical protein
MESLNIDALEAARLIAKALRIRHSTLRDADYARLLNRWQADPAFRSLVEVIAEGLELTVLEAGRTALWVAPSDADSLFAASLSEVREKLGEVDRGLLALLQVSIAATFFPSGRMLSSAADEPPSATLEHLLNVLLELCEQLRRRHADDVELADAGLREAWRAVLAKPLRQPESSRAALSSLEGMVRTVLARLEDYGLLKKETGADHDYWLPTPRYRAQLHELAANTVFQKCVLALEGGSKERRDA